MNELMAVAKDDSDDEQPLVNRHKDNNQSKSPRSPRKGKQLLGKKAFPKVKSKLLESSDYAKPMVLKDVHKKKSGSDTKRSSEKRSPRKQEAEAVFYSSRGVDIQHHPKDEIELKRTRKPMKANHDITTTHETTKRSDGDSKRSSVQQQPKYNIITHEPVAPVAQYISHTQMDLSHVRAKVDCKNDIKTVKPRRDTKEGDHLAVNIHPHLDISHVAAKVDCQNTAFALKREEQPTQYVSHHDEDYTGIDAKVETHNNHFKLIRRDVNYVQHYDADYSHVKSKVSTTWNKTPYVKFMGESRVDTSTKDIRNKMRSNASKSLQKQEAAKRGSKNSTSPQRQNSTSPRMQRQTSTSPQRPQTQSAPFVHATNTGSMKLSKEERNSIIKAAFGDNDEYSISPRCNKTAATMKVKKTKSPRAPIKADHDILLDAYSEPAAHVAVQTDDVDEHVTESSPHVTTKRSPVTKSTLGDFFYPISVPYNGQQWNLDRTVNDRTVSDRTPVTHSHSQGPAVRANSAAIFHRETPVASPAMPAHTSSNYAAGNNCEDASHQQVTIFKRD